MLPATFPFMTCEFCQTQGATEQTLIVSGQMQKAALCPKCIQDHSKSEAGKFSLPDMLSGLDNAREIKQDHIKEPACPQCGFTHADFKKTGHLGCPQCYVAFAEMLSSVLKDMHAGTCHKGKIPSR
jgi:protein arginine kinase activator